MSILVKYMSHEIFRVSDAVWRVILDNVQHGNITARDRIYFEAILWMLATRSRWKDLPLHYPSASSCYRRIRIWQECQILEELWEAYLNTANQHVITEWSKAFTTPPVPLELPCDSVRRRRSSSAWFGVMQIVLHWHVVSRAKTNECS